MATKKRTAKKKPPTKNVLSLAITGPAELKHFSKEWAKEAPVEVLCIRMSDPDTQLKGVMKVLASRPAPTLHTLALLEESFDESEQVRDKPIVSDAKAKAAWSQLSALQHLRVDGHRFFRGLDLPSLKTLHFNGLSAAVPMERKPNLPALEAFRLQLGMDQHGVAFGIGVVKALFTGKSTPALKRLDFGDADFDSDAEEIEGVISGPLLQQLEALSLELDDVMEEFSVGLQERLRVIHSESKVVPPILVPPILVPASKSELKKYTGPNFIFDANIDAHRLEPAASPKDIKPLLAHCHTLEKSELPRAVYLDGDALQYGTLSGFSLLLKAIHELKVESLSVIEIDDVPKLVKLHGSSLRSLHIEADLSVAWWKAAGELATSLPCLSSLRLESYYPEVSGDLVKSLLQTLGGLDLEELSLKTTTKSPVGTVHWTPLLKSLRSLDYHPFNDEELFQLLDAAKEAKLSRLAFTCEKLTSEIAQQMIEVTTGTDAVMELKVIHDELGPSEGIAEFVRGTQVERLWLVGRDEPAYQQGLWEALGDNRSLRRLHWNDSIQAETADAFATAILGHPTLREIHVEYSLESDSPAQLKRLIEACMGLDVLDGGQSLRIGLLCPLLEAGSLKTLSVKGSERQTKHLSALYASAAKSKIHKMKVSVPHDATAMKSLLTLLKQPPRALTSVDLSMSELNHKSALRILKGTPENVTSLGVLSSRQKPSQRAELRELGANMRVAVF